MLRSILRVISRIRKLIMRRRKASLSASRSQGSYAVAQRLKRANATFEVVFFTVIVIFAIIVVIVNYYGKSKKFYSGSLDEPVDARELKAGAELVIVGKISNVHQKINYQTNVVATEKGVTYYDIDIEKIERGTYAGNVITVAVGWFSNFAQPELLSPFLKKDYKKGDRIRIFVNHNSEDGYYTPALWYTIEPVI